jgi:hypothetical protein
MHDTACPPWLSVVFPELSRQIGYFFDPDSLCCSGHALQQKSDKEWNGKMPN